MFNRNKTRINAKSIIEIVIEVQFLIYQIYETDPDNELFESASLLDGKSIVEEYLQVNEYGLALEHIQYMIEESGIEVKKETIDILQKLQGDLLG